MTEPVLRVAAKALIVNGEGKVLILREATTYKDGSNTGRYHLPGGRLELGESFYDGLAREVREETGLEVEVQHALYVGEWHPVIRDVPHQIIAMFMLCRAKGTGVRLSEEHDKFIWIRPEEYSEHDLMEPEGKVIQTFLDLKL